MHCIEMDTVTMLTNTYPEMSHSVDLKSKVNQLVIYIKELLPTDDSSIIHQNGDFTNLLLDLQYMHQAMGKNTYTISKTQ